MPQKIILDVDTGGDDAVAILLAGHHPEIELVAVTVVHGNSPLDTTLENTLRVLEAGQLSHVPVYCGAESPLVAESLSAHEFQRRELALPPATISPQPQRAVDFLVEYYSDTESHDTILVPVGPQTNLALALRIEPNLSTSIPSIITMAGAFGDGNATPSAEFNVLADPEAAHIVFNSGIPLTMVGLEVTRQALLTLEEVYKINSLGTPWAQVAAGIIEQEVSWFIEQLGWTGGQIFDACAVAAVIDPGILETNPMHVDIELHGGLTRGRTVADISNRLGNESNVDVGVGIDHKKFIQILHEGFGISSRLNKTG